MTARCFSSLMFVARVGPPDALFWLCFRAIRIEQLVDMLMEATHSALRRRGQRL